MHELLKVLEHYDIRYEQKILCPFHADKNPSLMIDLEKDYWWCFGCQTGGDAYKFHKQYQNGLGITNELKILSSYEKLIGKKSKKNSSKIQQVFTQPIKDPAYFRQMLIEAKDYYNGLRTVDWYVSDDECTDYMTWRGFTRGMLNYSGAKYTYKDETYPIIFPIKDNGRFKGWVCRTFDFEIGQTRKYLYNKGFRRNSTLAGTYKKTEVVMIVEGYLDMLKAKQLGIKNVVAILGWKITNKQIEKLKNEGIDTIISALDNDKAGIAGYNYLKSHFKVVKFEYPESIKDMGDLNRKQFKIINKQIVIELAKENKKWE